MRLIDAHSHINFRAYADDRDEVVARARERGIAMLAVGSRHATSITAVEAAERYDGVWAAVGLHPTSLVSSHEDPDEAPGTEPERVFDPARYRELARHPKVVAIGECGLDYFHDENPEFPPERLRGVQQQAFRQHLDLALELDKPVMIHCRDAHDDLADILEEYATAGRPVRGNIHCFTGTVAEAQRYVTLGMFVSFTGIVTYKPRKADIERGETLHDVVRAVPLSAMLVETDCPYLAPEPHRGKRNEPAFVEHVAAKIAELKGVETREVEEQTTANARMLFGI